MANLKLDGQALSVSTVSGVWLRLRAHIDSLADDQLISTVEAGKAIHSTKGSLSGSIDFSLPDVMERSHLLGGQGRGPNRRVFGNPKAIKELRKQLDQLHSR